jgi:hydroxymethylglutaryl-CoA synthase
VSAEDSLWDRKLEKAFVVASKDSYNDKVAPSTLLPKRLGNMYTASLYAGLLSIVNEDADEMAGKRALMFSYGSGLAATMFSIRVGDSDEDKAALRRMRDLANVDERLDSRTRETPEVFNQNMKIREDLHKVSGGFEPQADLEGMFAGTYYLTSKDDLGRRFYDRV